MAIVDEADSILIDEAGVPLVISESITDTSQLGDLREAIYHGAVQRVRPKAMTVAVILAGLMPIFFMLLIIALVLHAVVFQMGFGWA